MDKPIYLILAEGFEEIEALGTVDFLRRLGLKITMAGAGDKKITGSHGITVQADIELRDIRTDDFHLILPGGMPGSTNLRDNEQVVILIRSAMKKGNLVSGICAAPVALEKAGALKGRKHTAHPSVKDTFKNSTYTGNRTETDGNLITGKGPGATIEFAVRIAEFLHRGKDAAKLAEDIMFSLQ